MLTSLMLINIFDSTQVGKDDDSQINEDPYSGIKMESDFRKKWEVKKKYDVEELNTGTATPDGGLGKSDKNDQSKR